MPRPHINTVRVHGHEWSGVSLCAGFPVSSPLLGGRLLVASTPGPTEFFVGPGVEARLLVPSRVLPDQQGAIDRERLYSFFYVSWSGMNHSSYSY